MAPILTAEPRHVEKFAYTTCTEINRLNLELQQARAEAERYRGALEHIATISENIVCVDGDDRMPLQQRIALQALEGTADD